MTYPLRAILVCCSAFVLVYVFSSAAIAYLTKPMARWIRSVGRRANLIYAVRMAPLALAFATVFLFTIPSFLRFEPAASHETLGWLPLSLTAGLLCAAAIGIRRAWIAYSQTQRWARRCMAGTASTGAGDRISVVSSPEAAPVALVGLRDSTVLISTAAQAALTGPEMRCAIAHELAHARAADNLKKLMIRACEFPGLGRLERAWLDAIEFAADSAAVRSDADAVELASALVKVSRLQAGTVPAIATGLTEGFSPLLAARVEQLLHREQTVEPSRVWGALMGTGCCAVFLMIAIHYDAILHAVHELTEVLVH